MNNSVGLYFMTLSRDQFYEFIFVICSLQFDKNDWPVFDVGTSASDKIMEIDTNRSLFVQVAKTYFEQIFYETSLARLSNACKADLFLQAI